MSNYKRQLLLLGFLSLFFFINAMAQNPFIRTRFSADPTARVFGDRVYIYCSHDIPVPVGSKARQAWFCMEDYHVYSSANLTDWTDHGMIVSQYKVNWVDSTAYNMWAPDCIYRNGKYYFYFPAGQKASSGRGFAVGIAIADKPFGPFVPQAEPIKNVKGIDPCVFIDKDGQGYLYWSQGKFFAAKLKENMLELASDVKVLEGLPTVGLIEGPFLFEHNGTYYMTYPHVQNKIERLEYAVSNSPMGPFKFGGVLMDESASGCWTNHQSVTNFKNQWYLFYHNNDLSPKFDKNRSIRMDSLFFNTDGSIRKVIPTLRGAGLTLASKQIQIDRFTAKSDKGVSVAFLDTLNTFAGWKSTFNDKNAWIQFNSVDFGKKNLKMVNVQASSKTGGAIQIRLNDVNGPVVAKIQIPKGKDWTLASAAISKYYPGIHNIVVQPLDDNNVEIDWVSFK